ncbi:hypothetical protein ACL02R_27290 [Streptomyces sp. MS19]|uniref:hypothetical protein n=1 Tax=unclassified Streptomyces TaxID=2593676 RepID=UPI00379FD17F
MRYIGYFRELNPYYPRVYRDSIHEAIARGAAYPVEQVVRYLESGHPFLDMMGVERDVVGGAFALPGGSSPLTDGEWTWREDLSHYVRLYAPALPDEFTAHVADRGGVVQPMAREELIAAAEVVYADLGYRRAR